MIARTEAWRVRIAALLTINRDEMSAINSLGAMPFSAKVFPVSTISTISSADEIVDIVDTGKTLAENGMAPRELIADISSRLIVNKAAMRTRHASVRAIIDALKSAVAQQGSAS